MKGPENSSLRQYFQKFSIKKLRGPPEPNLQFTQRNSTVTPHDNK